MSKILTLFASPIGITFFLCAVSLLFSYLHRQKTARSFLILAVAWLWGSSTSLFSDALYASLERTYAPVAIADLPQADAIVVLGGGVEKVAYPRDYPGLNQAGDRVLYGARLYKASKASKMVVSVGQVFPDGTTESEAAYSKILLVDWGVAEDDILLEANSRTTYENAIETKKIIDKEGWHRVLLVTSAAHMPRSVCVFEKAGVRVVAAPTDYEVSDAPWPFLLRIMPSSSAQNLTARGMKEYLGRWVYQWRGWC